jgi:hypothetical protein
MYTCPLQVQKCKLTYCLQMLQCQPPVHQHPDDPCEQCKCHQYPQTVVCLVTCTRSGICMEPVLYEYLCITSPRAPVPAIRVSVDGAVRALAKDPPRAGSSRLCACPRTVWLRAWSLFTSATAGPHSCAPLQVSLPVSVCLFCLRPCVGAQ